MTLIGRGGDLGGLGGRSPSKFEVGDGPCIRPGGRPMHPSPNILRSSVVGCARRYEQSKKGCHIGIFFYEIVVFLVRKGSKTTFNTCSKDTENLGKERENPKNPVDD